MNQDLKPITIFSILFFCICLISLIFWMRGEALEVGGPGQVQVDHNNNSVIHIADKLYQINPSLELLESYDLPTLGVYDLVGDFAFFSNGDILIRKGKYQPGLVDSVLHYLRITNTKPAVATLDNEGIYRCNLQNNQCIPFGTNQLDFDSAFHLSINNKTNTVYISDTSRHKLRKFDEQGNEIAVADEGFKFPNQNSIVGGLLWIADTNHHAIQKVNTETENFGEILESHSIGNPALQQKNWPYSFTSIGKNWWVNNMSHTMSKGSIAVYDENWLFVKILPLPANADPFDFAVLENQILITDFDNTTIYQLSINGELLKSTLPDEITLKLAQLKESRQFYINLTNGTVLLFVLFLILGFAIAIIQAKKQKNAEPITISDPLVIDINNPAIKWLALNKQKTLTLKWLFILLTLGLITTTILIAEIKTTIIMIIATLIIMLLMFINFSKKIGTLDDVLIIKYFNQKYVAGTNENIYFSDNQIMIGALYIPFNSQQLMYDTEQMVKEVMPTLRYATYVPPRQMMRMILKHQNPKLLAFFFLLITLGAGALMLDGIELS